MRLAFIPALRNRIARRTGGRSSTESRRASRRLHGEWLEPRQMLAAQPIISEFQAENKDTLLDGHGNSSDWIEIFNAGDAPLDLAGWHLTDSPLALDQWTFPSTSLGAGQFLVVFASGSGIPDPQGHPHTNFDLDKTGGYLALVHPDGVTKASEYAAYPSQRENASYGAQQTTVTNNLVQSGAAARLLVPDAAADAAVGSSWTGAAAFDDAAWMPAQIPVGYDDGVGQIPPTLANVALGKPTSQSTNYPNFTGAAGTDGSTAAGNITHTATGDLSPWWEVDLGASSVVDSITLYNRVGCCPERLYNINVEVRDAANNIVYTSAMLNPNNVLNGPATIALDLTGVPGGVAGQKVRVRKTANSGSEWLSLAEVQVFSYVVVPVNVALGAPVTASGATYGGLPQENVTDGNPGTFSHNLVQDNTFNYQIKLSRSFALDRVEIVNRGDGCCADRLTQYRVSIHADNGGVIGPAVWTGILREEGSNSGVGGVDTVLADLDPAGTFEGQWIQIENIDNGADRYLQIAEVRAYEVSSYDPLIQTDVDSALKNVNASAYLRVPFQVADPTQFNSLTLRTKYDDGFVAYLNGVEIARANAPGGTPAFDAAATAAHLGFSTQSFPTAPALLRVGQNMLAIHALNVAAGDDDFFVAPELVAVSISQTNVGFFPTPTPGAVNGPSVAGFVADTIFDSHRGFYDAPVDVHITTATPGATIVYTTDGSAPTLTNGTVVAPPDAATPPAATVHLTTTTVLRAAAIKTGFAPTNVDTNTYLFLADVIHQPASPVGLPTTWNGSAADYEMDPDVVNDPLYSDEIIDGLKSIRTMSIVMDPDDFLGPTDGIYTFPERLGDAYERPASIEMINTDGSTAFQVDAGIRVWGTGWRPHSSTPKHAFQLKFREKYGPKKLDYPLFPDTAVTKFDDLILRAQGSRGWTDFRAGALEIGATQYIHDAWGRDTAAAMGKIDGHSTYVHLYINGLYWGLYNPVERPTGSFGEEYFGGDDEDYDVISHRVGEPVVANEGDLVAWNEMQALANAGLTTPQAYAAIQAYVDIDNLIDYMLVNQYATNHDGPASGNNLRALRKREPNGQFRFYFWDFEYTFWSQTENSNINIDVADTIARVYARLRDNPEFRQRYADRAYKHLTNGGALTPDAAAARWQARADEIFTAIISESARWGDVRRAIPFTRDADWAAELNRLKTQYFPARTQILIDQLKAVGLFPTVAAPEFYVAGAPQPGGAVAAGAPLELRVNSPPGYIDTTLVASGPGLGGAPAQVLVPTSDALGQSWTQIGFNDFVGWTAGTTGVGYDNNPAVDFNPSIGVNIGLSTPSSAEPTSVFVRIEFNVPDLAAIDKLTLRMKYDDGFVPYLNGTELTTARRLAPGSAGTPPAFNDRAFSSTGAFRTDSEALVFEDIDVTAFKNLLVAGTNVLAIHGLNQAPNSSDFLVLPELVAGRLSPGGPLAIPIYYTLDGSDPRQSGGVLSSGAVLYTGPVPLNQSAQVATRTLNGGNWSALGTASFTVPTPLRVTEIMYHPSNPTPAELVAGFTDDDDFEFIELMNVDPTASVDLSGIHFAAGIGFTFGAELLGPGERIVVPRNRAAFDVRYAEAAPTIRIAGQYGGTPDDFGLDNGGEQLELLDANNGVIQSFVYNDLQASTDGDGNSLVIIDPNGNPADWSTGAAWRPSHERDGSPGEKDVILGDLNEDNRVNLLDLAILHSHLGVAAGAIRSDGDLNHNGAVTRGDLVRMLANYGRVYPPPPIPSPPAGSPPVPAPLAPAPLAPAVVTAAAPASLVQRTVAVPSRLRAPQRSAAIAGADRSEGPASAVSVASERDVSANRRSSTTSDSTLASSVSVDSTRPRSPTLRAVRRPAVRLVAAAVDDVFAS